YSAHQDTLDYGHAVPVADGARLRRERSRGDRCSREDLSRGGGAYRAGDVARRDPAPDSRGRQDSRGARRLLQHPAHVRRRRLPTGKGGVMRVGRIPYVNCYPVYGAIDRGVVPLDAEIVDGVPSALNAQMAARTLDVSVISAVEYARDSRQYLLLPDLA